MGRYIQKREAISIPSGFNMSNETYFVAMEMMHQKQKKVVNMLYVAVNFCLSYN